MYRSLFGWALVSLFVSGCTTGDKGIAVGDSGAGVDSAGDSGGDSASDTSAGLDGAASELSARLHGDIPSIIYVSWTQLTATEQVWVEYTDADGTVETTPVKAGSEGAHEQIVLGVPYDMAVTWRLIVRSGDQEVAFEGPPITTGAVPEDLPLPVLDLADAPGWDPEGRFLLTSVSVETPLTSQEPGFWVVLLDRQGRYVWAVRADPGSWTLFAQPSRDGRSVLYDDSLFWTDFDGGQDSKVHELRLDGTEVNTWATPGLAHAFDNLSPGTIAWTAEGDQDAQLYVSEAGNEPTFVWSCLDWVVGTDVARSPTNPGRESCGSNSLFWNEDRNTYTMSLWSHETVIELDPTSGDVLWYSDPNEGHGYPVTPEDAIWHWEHEAQLLSADRLLLSSGVDPRRDGSFGATAAYEYQIDHDLGTLTLVWSYVSEPEFAARFKGGARRLANGNTLTYYGSAGGVKEVTPAGEVVWQVRFEGEEDTWTGRSYFLGDLYPFAP